MSILLWDRVAKKITPGFCSGKPDFWCSISYFELDEQVGEMFKVRNSFRAVTIDGYTNPSLPNRFCVGQLTNVHRTDMSDKIRPYIGKGVKLLLEGEGDVWILCCSDMSIFAQSFYLDSQAGRAPGDVVHKIYPKSYIKVFDLRQFSDQVMQRLCNAQTRADTQAFAGIKASKGSRVDELRKLGVLRFSFATAWGPDYNRREIKEVPCWIEVQFHRALQLLDELLSSHPIQGQEGRFSPSLFLN